MANGCLFSSDRFDDEPPNFVSAESVLDDPAPSEAAPFDDDLLSFASAADLDCGFFDDDCSGDLFEPDATAKAAAEASGGYREFVDKAPRRKATSQPASQASGCPNSQPPIGKDRSAVRRSSHSDVIPRAEGREPTKKKRRESASLGAGRRPLSPEELVGPLSPAERSIIAAGDGALLFRDALRKLSDSMERTELSRRQVAMQRAAMDLARIDAGPAAPRASLSGNRDTLTMELDAMAKELDRNRVQLQRMFNDCLARRSHTS